MSFSGFRPTRGVLGVISLVMLSFTGTFALRILTPALSFFMREDLNASLLGVSSLTIAYMLGRSLSAYFSGRIITGKNTYVIPPLSLIVSFLLVFLYPYATSWILVSSIRGIQGFLMGLTWPIIQAVVATTVRRGVRGGIMSSYFFAGSIAGPASNWIYAAFLAEMPIYSSVVFSGIFYLASALLAFIGAYLVYNSASGSNLEAPPVKTSSKEKVKHTKTTMSKNALLLLGFGIGGIASLYGFSAIYVYLKETFDLTKESVAFLLGLVDMVALAIKLVSGFLADKYGLENLLKISIGVSIAGILIMIPSNYILFLMGLSLIVFGSSGFKPVSRALASLFPEPKDVIGKLNSFSNIGTVTAQLLAGGLYEVLKYLLPFVTPFPIILVPYLIIITASGIGLTRLEPK